MSNSIGSNKNIRNMSKLRDEIAVKIAGAINMEKEDERETTPPAPTGEAIEENGGKGENGEMLQTNGSSEKIPDTEDNKNLGTSTTPVEDGNAKDKADENLAKRAGRITGLIADLRGKKQASADKSDSEKEESDKPPAAETGEEEETEAPAPDAKPKNEGDDTAEKEATVKEILENMDVNAVYKLASVVLTTDKLANEVSAEISRYLDKQAARAMIEDAMYMSELYEQELQKEAALTQAFENQVNALTKSASAEDKKLVEKIASVHTRGVNRYKEDYEKRAYMAGASDAATAMDNGDELPLPDEGAAPSDEEIMEVVDEMVANGELPPEVADEIVTELAAEGLGEGGAAPEEEMIDPETLAALEEAEGMAPEEEAAPEEAAPEEEEV